MGSVEDRPIDLTSAVTVVLHSKLRSDRSSVPAKGLRCGGLMVDARPNALCLLFGSGGHRRAGCLVGNEVGLVAQHPVQHDGELAGHGDGGLAQAGAPGDAEPPGLRSEPLMGRVRMMWAAS